MPEWFWDLVAAVIAMAWALVLVVSVYMFIRSL